MRTRALMTALALLVLAGTAVGCGSDSSDDTADATTTTAGSPLDLSDKDYEDRTGEASTTVDAVENAFRPEYVEVSVGTEVTFHNDGRNPHNVLPVVEGSFAEIPTEDFDPGAEVTVTFGEAGDFAFYCSLHGTPTKGMVGAVRVVE